MINTQDLSLPRGKKNLVRDVKMAHQYRYKQWSSLLDDIQLKFITTQKRAREERLTRIPKNLQSNDY